MDKLEDINLNTINKTSNKIGLNNDISYTKNNVKSETKSIIYMFSGNNESAIFDSNGGLESGFSLHKKYGGKLLEFSEGLLDITDAIKLLQAKNITTIYTGKFEGNFLGLYTTGYGDNNCEPDEYLLSNSIIEEHFIPYIESFGIKVIVLDQLK